MTYRLATLPFSRRRLRQLATVPHEGLEALPEGLSLEEAAQPTPAGADATAMTESGSSA